MRGRKLDDTREHQIIVPDLGLTNVPTTVSLWLVPAGRHVCQGDRIVELLAGDVTVDLGAPVDGVLGPPLVAEDQPVRPGDVLGMVYESTGSA